MIFISKNGAPCAMLATLITALEYHFDIQKSACLTGQTKLDLLAKL